MMRKTAAIGIAASAALSLALGLTACTLTGDTSEQPSSSENYVEPGWMAETRQEAEEQSEIIANCLREHGYKVTILPDNGFTHPPESDEVTDARVKTAADCIDERLDPDRFATTEAEYRELYQKALDTRDCLADAGYPIDEPPSEDTWIAALQNDDPDLWVPFASLIEQKTRGEIYLTEEKYYELYDRCPQAGPVAGM